MTYYSHTEKELARFGIQEGELAIYTGTRNPRTANTLSPGVNEKNAYVYLWQDGQPRELDTSSRHDRAGLDVFDLQTGGEEYIFLRDKPSGYIRQVSGPAKPVVVANIGAIPLRVDTCLGKFTVYAGTILRLDENAPQREKKKVLLTVSSLYDHPLLSAELWDGISWRRLNIREEPFSIGGRHRLAVLDGSAIVQYMEVSGKREILMMDSPEPDPDYEIYVTTQGWDEATLCFNRSDYRDGRVVQRKRTIAYGIVSAPGVYDLQKLKETQTQSAMHQCIIELPGMGELPAEGETGLPPKRRRRPLISDKLRDFLGGENKSDEPLLEHSQADTESRGEDHRCSDSVSRPEELAQAYCDGQKAPVPEPPENFPA